MTTDSIPDQQLAGPARPAMTHDQLVDKVLWEGRRRGLLAHYCRRSVWCNGQRGLPDLLIAGPGGVLWREIKIWPDTTTAEQDAWLWTLRQAGQDAAVWELADLESGKIAAELDRIASRRP